MRDSVLIWKIELHPNCGDYRWGTPRIRLSIRSFIRRCRNGSLVEPLLSSEQLASILLNPRCREQDDTLSTGDVRAHPVCAFDDTGFDYATHPICDARPGEAHARC